MASVGATIGNEGPELSCGLKKKNMVGVGEVVVEGEKETATISSSRLLFVGEKRRRSTTLPPRFCIEPRHNHLQSLRGAILTHFFHHENPLTYSFPIVHPGIFSLSTFFPLSVVASPAEPRLPGSAVAPPPVSSLLPGGVRRRKGGKETVVSGLFLSVLYRVILASV